jgi:hypothetical protein
MPDKEETVKRKRMVVEEVAEAPEKDEEKEAIKPDILDEGAKVSSEELIKEEKEENKEDEVVKEEAPIEREIQEISPETHRKKSISPVFWIIIPGIFLLGAILGGIVFYQKGINKGQGETSPTPNPVVSVTPTASPSASINLTKYTVDIFNGSGISGEAGRVKSLLTGAGFKIGTTANAATYGYTKTIVKIKSTIDSDFVSALSTALSKTYIVDTAQTLATSSADDVQVIVGNSKVTTQ